MNRKPTDLRHESLLQSCPGAQAHDAQAERELQPAEAPGAPLHDRAANRTRGKNDQGEKQTKSVATRELCTHRKSGARWLLPPSHRPWAKKKNELQVPRGSRGFVAAARVNALSPHRARRRRRRWPQGRSGESPPPPRRSTTHPRPPHPPLHCRRWSFPQGPGPRWAAPGRRRRWGARRTGRDPRGTWRPTRSLPT